MEVYSPSSAHTCSAVAAAVVDSSRTCRLCVGMGVGRGIGIVVAARPGLENETASDVEGAEGRSRSEEARIETKCLIKVGG